MQPPTDNLYKFLAIFGLVVVGFSIYVPLQRLEVYGRSSVQLEAAYEPIIERLKVVGDASRTELECAINETKKRDGAGVDSSSACDQVIEARSVAERVRAELVALQTKIKSLQYDRNFLYGQYRLYLYMGLVAGCLGLVLCVAGFWLWYVRVQRFLDAAARRDA